MPIYEYECGRCRSRFEMRQGFDAEPEALCPQCQGKSRRLFHSTAIVFKGSGFYITDSRQSTTATTKAGKKKIGKKEEAKGKPDNEGTAPAS